MSARGSKRRVKLLRLALAAVLISALFVFVDGRKVLELLAGLDPGLAAVAVAIAALDRAFMAAKWYPLVRAQVQSVSLFYTVRVYWASSFAAKFLPMSVGGDILRMVAVGRARGEMPEVGASIVIERLLGMCASGLVALGAVGVGMHAGLDPAFLIPWAVGAAGLSILLLLAPFYGSLASRLPFRIRRRFMRDPEWLRRFRSAYGLFRKHGPLLAAVGVGSLVEQGVPILVLWVLSIALGTSIQFHMLLFAVPLTLLISRLPFSMWALGIAEGALIFLLGPFGIPPAEALAVGLAGRAAELVAVLPGALWWHDLLHGPEPVPYGVAPSAPSARPNAS